MAPHALVENTSSSASVHLDAPSNSLLKANPFGTLVDPAALKGTTYTSLNTVLSQTVYAISSKIFSYETPGSPDLLDAHIQLWTQAYQRPNSFGVVPFFHKLQVRSGASNAILGYYSKNGTAGQPISVLLGLNGLVYMQPNLAARSNYTSLPLSLNVSAIDFDSVSNSLVSNYIASLSVARSLGYSVVTPVHARDAIEFQHLTILNHYLASLTGSPSINLFDGPEFAATFTKLDVLSVAQVGELYQGLLAGSASVEYTDLNQAVDLSLQKLNQLTGKSYSQFEYVGSDAPETVFVSYGAHESTQVSEIVAKSANIGLIKVRVPLPFNQAKFIEAIPSTTKKLVVLSQVSHNENVTSSLKADITAALFLGGAYHRLSIDEFKYPLSFAWTPITVAKVLAEFVPSLDVDSLLAHEKVALPVTLTANTCPEGNFLFWGRDNSWTYTVQRIALSLSLDDSKTVTIRNKYDNSRGGGLFQSQISSSSKANASSIDSADVVLLDNLSILDSYDVLATAKPGATIVYIHNKPFGSVEEDIVPKLPVEFRRTLAVNHNKLLLVDFSILEKLESISSSASGFAGEFLTQLAFWRASLPELKGFIVNKLLQANGNDYELLAAVLDKFIQTVDEQKGLREISVAPEWADLEEEKKEEEKKEEEKEKKEEEEVEEEASPLPFFPTETSFFANPCVATEDSEETIHSGYKSLATKLTFPEAYGLKQDLRPELPVKNFIVKVQENKRLTPQEYSRNIFHIEFDTTGTDLKYDIGEALGIHGRNNAEEVERFLQYFGVDGDSLVETTNRDDPSVLEVRSARQILTDGVDFLGKPPKRFYEALAEYAVDEKEKAALEKLASAEGAAELKKRQEVDFDTYFDVLDEFKSARPAFSDLVRIIAPLKRREYSIASSQKLHPNSVHLLIVVVDWIDPRGRTRYGHTSKYLSDLKIGDELVVSVKPSVMKLPPLSTQPIVMSGLGTGLAPFKAFVEEKIWQQQQGMEIGEIYLYMGSRHKKEEYLYGELWEAYKDAGILTHIGAAFSRDQPEKIYIQDKIRESIEDLTDAIVAKNGSFYLCGPTWPVPDITACLEDIVQNGAKKEGKVIKEIAKVVEEMKENGRYILEVY